MTWGKNYPVYNISPCIDTDKILTKNTPPPPPTIKQTCCAEFTWNGSYGAKKMISFLSNEKSTFHPLAKLR